MPLIAMRNAKKLTATIGTSRVVMTQSRLKYDQNAVNSGKSYDQKSVIAYDINSVSNSWVCQGSVVEVARPQGEARPYYRWTRKEDQKTVTVALSAPQVKVFRRAMKQHRQLQRIIRQMRQLSAQVLLETTAGVPRRKRRKSS